MKWPSSSIWPVEDTGMNSVSPSTRPRMMAANQSDMENPENEWAGIAARPDVFP